MMVEVLNVMPFFGDEGEHILIETIIKKIS